MTRTIPRLAHYDYASPGAYFITCCTWRRRERFAQFRAGALENTVLGDLVAQNWQRIAHERAGVSVEELVLMPDHVHGIIWLSPEGGTQRVDVRCLVSAFKAAVVRDARRLGLHGGGHLWQRGYYDRVIRNDAELAAIRSYVLQNRLALLVRRAELS